MRAIGIVGAGQAGIGLALALTRSGCRVRLHGRTCKPMPTGLEASFGGPPPWVDHVTTVLLAIPDDTLMHVADMLLATAQVTPHHCVLHLSGVRDAGALEPLRATGCAVGSFHPLLSFGDPEIASERLAGATVAVEGDERALQEAERLADAVGLIPVHIPAKAKPLYHAAAVFASNYFVVVSAVANRLMQHAGLSPERAWRALLPLIEGTLDNMRRSRPASVLTGPVARGDRETVQRHLADLPSDLSELYRALGRTAVELAGLDPERKRAVAEELADLRE